MAMLDGYTFFVHPFDPQYSVLLFPILGLPSLPHLFRFPSRPSFLSCLLSFSAPYSSALSISFPLNILNYSLSSLPILFSPLFSHIHPFVILYIFLSASFVSPSWTIVNPRHRQSRLELIRHLAPKPFILFPWTMDNKVPT